MSWTFDSSDAIWERCLVACALWISQSAQMELLEPEWVEPLVGGGDAQRGTTRKMS